MGRFHELLVLERAYQLALDIHQETRTLVTNSPDGLLRQLQSSAVAVATHIAQGYRQPSTYERIGRMAMAEESLEKLQEHLWLAQALGYLPINIVSSFRASADDIARKLGTMNPSVDS